MSRARIAVLIAGILLAVSVPPAAAKTDVLRLARRALNIAERADKAARAKPEPVQSRDIADRAVANPDLGDGRQRRPEDLEPPVDLRPSRCPSTQ